MKGQAVDLDLHDEHNSRNHENKHHEIQRAEDHVLIAREERRLRAKLMRDGVGTH